MSQIYAQNLGKNITATDLGAGKVGLDIAGVVVVTEGATAANAAVGLPAVVKVVAGYDGANVRVLATDLTGKLNVNADVGTVLAVTTVGTITNDVGVKPNNHGEHSTSTVSVAATVSAPAGAIGFIFSADDTNTANIRISVGGTASVSSGMQYQPGRDTGYVPAGCDVSLCAESGTQGYTINWIKRS